MKLFSLILSCWLIPAYAFSSELTDIQINNKSIQVETASTAQEREIGLMYRKKLPADSGMLFKFDKDAPVCMWMKNTYIPLSVAFIDKNGQIINIEDMAPLTENIHCSRRPARYALEMNQGWFQRQKIKNGDKVSNLR